MIETTSLNMSDAGSEMNLTTSEVLSTSNVSLGCVISSIALSACAAAAPDFSVKKGALYAENH